MARSKLICLGFKGVVVELLEIGFQRINALQTAGIAAQLSVIDRAEKTLSD